MNKYLWDGIFYEYMNDKVSEMRYRFCDDNVHNREKYCFCETATNQIQRNIQVIISSIFAGERKEEKKRQKKKKL